MKKSIRTKFFLNTSWQIICQLYTMLLSLIVGVLTARYLGPSNYGLIGYGQSMVALFNAIATLGMGEVIIKDFVERKEQRDVIIGSALLMRFISSILSVVLIQMVVYVLEPNNKVLHIITILQAFGLLLQSCDVLTYWFQAKMEFIYPAIGTMIASSFVALWRISLLVKGVGVEWFAFSSCIQYLFTGLIAFVIYSNKYGGRYQVSLDVMLDIFSRSKHFILSNLAIALYTQMDKVMLGKMLGESQVGIYTAAATIAGLWEFIPASMINSAKPILYKSFSENKEHYAQEQSLLYVGLSVLSIVVGVTVTLFGRIAIFLLYGSQYIEANVALKILIWATGFSIIGSARGATWVIVNNLSKYVKYMVIISSLINIMLNFVLIPIFGITGAAVATLISQASNTFLSPLLFKEMRLSVKVYLESWSIMIKVLSQKFKN